MGLIDPRSTLSIADRIGKRYYFALISAISGCPDSSSDRGDNFYAMCHVCPDGDPQIETATLSSANTSDNAWSTSSDAWTIATSMFGAMSSSYSIISALTTHFNTATSGGQQMITGGWNQYLETADPTGTDYVNMPTIVSTGKGVRVSEYFRRVAALSGLRARNVFYDAPDAFEFGIITGTGSDVTYTNIGDFGTGTSTALADGSSFAATRMKLVVPEGSQWTQSCTLEIQVVTEPDGDTETITQTVPVLAEGESQLIGADETARYTKVLGVSVASGTPALGDSLVIENVFERVIEL